jgi:hypothetical protein
LTQIKANSPPLRDASLQQPGSGGRRCIDELQGLAGRTRFRGGGARRLKLAAALAERFAAHLVGLYPVPIPEAPPHFGYYDPALLAPFFEELRARAREAADGTKEMFEHLTGLRGLSAEWREIPEGPEGDPALHARYADLTILGQLDPDSGEAEMIQPRPEHVTLASGRPILVVPYAGNFDNLGRRVLVGWNATREAARAVNDAMPLLAGAEIVTVLTIDPREGTWRALRGGHLAAFGPPRRQGGNRAHGLSRSAGWRGPAVPGRRPWRRSVGDGRLRPFPGARVVARRRDTLVAAQHDLARADVALSYRYRRNG